MPLWLIFVLISVVVMAGSEITQKITMTAPENISSETSNFFVWLFQALLGVVVFFLFSNHNTDFSIAMVPRLLLVGSVYFWAGTLYYSSYKGSSAGLSTILGTVSMMVSTTLGIIFFNESVGLLKLLGVSLVFGAIIIARFTRNLHFDKYNLLAMSGGALWGVAFSIDKSFATTINPLFYLPLFCLVTGLTGLIYRPKIILSEIKIISKKSYKSIFWTAFFGTAFNMFTFLSYSHGGEVGRVDAINNTMVFLVIILEYFILKEKKNIFRKLIAAAIAIVGVTILAFVK